MFEPFGYVLRCSNTQSDIFRQITALLFEQLIAEDLFFSADMAVYQNDNK